MKSVLKKQLDEMIEDELKDLLRRDYLRRLTRYRMMDDFYRKNIIEILRVSRRKILYKKKIIPL